MLNRGVWSPDGLAQNPRNDMGDEGDRDVSLLGMDMIGKLVLIGTSVGLRFLRIGRSGISRAVITGTEAERGGPIGALAVSEDDESALRLLQNTG